MAHCIELRTQVYEAYSKTRIPVEQIARSFGISRASVYNWRSRMRQSDSLERSEKRGGRRPKLDEEARQHLRRLLHERCEWTLAELCLELERISGVQVHRATMSRTLRRMGLKLGSAKAPSKT
jgi:transposase